MTSITTHNNGIWFKSSGITSAQRQVSAAVTLGGVLVIKTHFVVLICILFFFTGLPPLAVWSGIHVCRQRARLSQKKTLSHTCEEAQEAGDTF